MKKTLLPPVPPFADSHDPRVIVWRLDQHEEAIEYLDARIAPPPQHASLLRLAWVAFCVLAGRAGVFTPAQAVALLRALVH